MSRIGKLPVAIPDGVKVEIKDQALAIKGPNGVLDLVVHPDISVETENGKIRVKPKTETKLGKSLFGLTRSLIANMVDGVTKGYTKKLEIVGIGYKANVEGRNLVLNLGFSHPIVYPIPEGIKVSVDKQINISISGIDKQRVGQFAAEIRRLKSPEPYKGKGIRYEGESVRRKVGKAGA